MHSTSSSSSVNHSIEVCGSAVFVLQDAAQPQAGGGLEGLQPDLAADQVGRLLNALAGVDEDEAVAEAAMQEHRQRRKRLLLVARHQVGRGRALRHVEIAVAQEAPVARGGIHLGEHGELDAVGLDGAFIKRADDLVIAAGERQGNAFRQGSGP